MKAWKMISRFKIRILEGGKERWADASKVFAHLLKEYTKAELKGKKPEPYKDRVNNFFDTIDEEWLDALKKAYPKVDLKQELENAKMWLLSNTKNSKSDFKKFINNWLAKAMRNSKDVPTDNRSNYKPYKPPEVAEEDLATPEEINKLMQDTLKKLGRR